MKPEDSILIAGAGIGGLTAALNAMDCTLAGQLKAMLDSVAN